MWRCVAGQIDKVLHPCAAGWTEFERVVPDFAAHRARSASEQPIGQPAQGHVSARIAFQLFNLGADHFKLNNNIFFLKLPTLRL